MNEQAAFWAGDFGNAYTQRNRVDWQARIPFWKEVLDITGARSVFEYGCNAGWNLSAIRRIYSDVAVYGLDVNFSALIQAKQAGLVDVCAQENLPMTATEVIHNYENHSAPKRLIRNKGAAERCELTFTSGVLIHIAPVELKQTMEKLVNASYDYVLAVEYEADKEEEVNYRGHSGKLWRRPYGRLYQEMGLTLVKEWKAEGFDNCTAWLLRK